ncbi:MAG: hypothetical protein AB7L71_16775 [Vicinamibacterales bacterium]
MRTRLQLPLAGLLVGLVLLVPRVVQTQQFVLSSQDRARLIAVDFSATGPDGAPLTDLRAEDVTIRIDGRARPIRALEYVPSRGLWTDLPTLPYGSNVATDDGRGVLLVVDFETIRPGREAGLRSEISSFLQRLSPADRVALVAVPYGGVKVDLTTDHARVMRTLSTMSGQSSGAEADADASCRTRTTLVSLRGLLDDLSSGEAPTVVVVFTNRMSSPSGVQMIQSGQPLGRCQLMREHFEQVGEAAARARAQLYLVQPDLSDATGRAGIEHLTGVTGAPLWPLEGTDGGALGRVARETGGYYLARVEPEPDETNGSLQRLSVTVAREGAVVRARPQLMIARPTRRADQAPATPLTMMKDVRLFRDLPLRVTAFAAREASATEVRIVAVFDSPDPAAALNEAMIGLFTEEGRLVASRTLTSAELQADTIITALSAPPGRYRLRVAAAEAAGRAGAADVQLEAGLATAGSLRLSDLVLGLTRDGQFRPRLEFGREASATAQFELYGGREGVRVGVVVEVARTAAGPALVSMPGTFTATDEADKFLVSAAVPIGALPAGDYVVRATIAAEGQAAGRVVRPLRKVIR